MKFWVGVTDTNWFRFLRARAFDEVNFWQPSARPMFLNIEPGTPFFFKLKKPLNHIGGYGTFVSFVKLPMSLAWEAFGEKNGAESFAKFNAMIRPLCPNPEARDPEIGCTLLAEPRFFDDDDFSAAPSDWASNIVRGRSYSSSDIVGAQLLELASDSYLSATTDQDSRRLWFVEEERPRYSLPYLARARLGQGTFRALVTGAYERRCAITGENILPVLDAAHIKPFSLQGPHQVSNGLLLRSDFHKLFDLGYVTVTRDLRVEVSKRIHEEWFNGKAYYRLHGQPLALVPSRTFERPDPVLLDWHNENCFQA